MAQLFNAIIKATGEKLQVYQSETNPEVYLSPKYPGRGFTVTENLPNPELTLIEILSEA